jgi:DNA-binding transcriptional regulator YiaG
VTREQILELRKKLGLTQAQFGKLFGAHPITVVRWESGEYQPNTHQIMLMENFEKSAQDKEVQKTLAGILIGAGVAAALFLLLKAAMKSK